MGEPRCLCPGWGVRQHGTMRWQPALQRLLVGLQDAYLHVHSQIQDRETDPLEGFTFGFGVQDKGSNESGSSCSDDSEFESKKNLRRIDRFHMSSALISHVSEAFTAFVAKADHKAVMIVCSPPSFDMSSVRFKCPQELLEDPEVVDKLKKFAG